ncbi:unnamed protein product [Brassica rapa subsp. trilocularis]|uniref:(rape) hypothetical protein n=1 Tax=Brassica napus TaxID=3708 RepID=A0A816KD96_BRANA|nr:unnamed protein product [Brassica napus]
MLVVSLYRPRMCVFNFRCKLLASYVSFESFLPSSPQGQLCAYHP